MASREHNEEIEPEAGAEQSPEEPLDRAGQGLFWRRLGVFLLLFVALEQGVLLLSSLLHEVLGHGLSAIILGGTFAGMSLRWEGSGWAAAVLPFDASPFRTALVSASGILVTIVFGLAFLRWSFRLRDRLVSRITCLLFAAHCLDFDYIFWNSWHPAPPGDIATILSDIGASWLRWPLMIASFPLMVGCYFWLTSLIYQSIEEWAGGGSRLREARRVVTLVAIVVVPALISLVLSDWEAVAPGMGPVPGIFHGILAIVTAIVLFFRSPETRPLPESRTRPKELCRPVVAWWAVATALTLSSVLWLGEGLYWSSSLDMYVKTSTPSGTFYSLAVSPHGRHVVFQVAVPADNEDTSQMQLALLKFGSASAQPVIPPGRWKPHPYTASWSADSRKLVVTLMEEPSPGTLRYAVWGFDLDRRTWTRRFEPEDGPCWYSLFAPGGESFLVHDPTAADLIVVGAEGGAHTHLLTAGDAAGGACGGGITRPAFDWSPDGKAVYYSKACLADPGITGIWTSDVSGANERLLFKGYEANRLEVSRSGRFIAFTVRDKLAARLYAGSTEGDTVELVSRDSGFFGWGTARDRLVYVTSRGLMVWSPIGGRSKCLLTSSEVYDAAWIPGTNEILYVEGVELWRMDADTGARERIPFDVDGWVERFDRSRRRGLDRK